MASSVPAGTWKVLADIQCASGGGPDNIVTVICKHKDSSCSLIATLFTITLPSSGGLTTGTTAEYSNSASVGIVDIDDDETIELDFEQTSGNQQVRVHYDDTAGSGGDSRLEIPGVSGEGQRRIAIGD